MLSKKLTFTTETHIIISVMIMIITSIGYNWAEKKNFTINRPHGINTYTVIFFRSSVEIEIDGNKVLTKPGAFIVYDIHMPQWYRMPNDIVHDWFHVDAAHFPNMRLFSLEFGKIYYPYPSAKIIRIFSDISNNFYSESPLAERLCRIKIEELLITVRQLSYENNNFSLNTAEAVRQTHKIMLSEYKKDWSVSSLAQNANMSESRFFAVYKSIYGTSPINTLIKFRINIAKNLLLTDNYSVNEVAEEVGYKNIYHFIRYFKKETGVTPGKYCKTKMPKD